MNPDGGASRIPQYLLPSLPQAVFLIVFLGCFSGSGDFLLGDGDTGYHIRAGEIILRDTAVPRHDPFSFISPPLPWTAHEWLSEAVMAMAHKAWGLAGVVLLFALLLSTTYWALCRAIRTRRRNLLSDLLILVLVLLSSRIHWHARPHVFTLLSCVLLYHVLIHHQEDRGNYLYVIPPMMLLWVNLHGGFILGFVFLGTFLSGYFLKVPGSKGEERAVAVKKGKQLFLVCAASALAACVNPYGFHAFLFPFRVVSETYLMEHVQEFMSPDFHKAVPYRYLLLFLIGILGFSRVALNVTETVLVLLFTSMSLYSARYIPLCAIVYAPILSKHGDILMRRSEARWSKFLLERSVGYQRIDASAKGRIVPLLVLGVVVALAAGKVPVRFPEATAPTAAIEFLRTNPMRGNMFNNDEIGDYVIYYLYPQYKVFMDGRSDMYGTGILKEYERVIYLEPGWRDVLAKYDINFVFYYTDSVLSRVLSDDKGWIRIYSDNVASLFLKNSPENAETATKYTPGVTVTGSEP